MCLAIPARISQLHGNGLARVDILGVSRDVSLDLTPQVKVGDYVLVHAGFAIEQIDEVSAQETVDLIKQFPELVAEDIESVRASVTTESPEMVGAGV